MKFLRNLLDKVEPTFKKGGKLERMYPLYEALDTFLYTPGEVTKSQVHVRDALDMKRMMTTVIVALLPCIGMALWNTGYQANLAITGGTATPIQSWREPVLGALGFGDHDPTNVLGCIIHGALWFLPLYIVTMVVGGTCELIFAAVRGHEINEGFLVTGMLYPLTLPATTPLYITALGIAFGVVLGKEVFGGTGKNFLNPALVARAFVYFAYAPYCSGETNPLGQGVWTAAQAADGFSGATTLGAMPIAEVGRYPWEVMGSDTFFWDAFFGVIPGSLGETSALACLIGAAILIASGIGSWRIMTGVVIGSLGMAAVCYGFRESLENPVAYIPPHWHLVVGGLAFGAVFMATDPVSAAMTQKGMWIYGIVIGVLSVMIRVINPAYPEGVMLAILFGNALAPLIDHFVIQANVNRRRARYGT